MADAAARAQAPQIGLYYPRIHFRDDQWVKMAALYWDGMFRIVPRHFIPRDSAVVRALTARGFITNHPPTDYQLLKASRPFLSLLDDRSGELRGRYALVQRAGDVETVDGRAVRTEILSPKVSTDLDKALRESGLAVLQIDPSGIGSLYVHPLLADVYLAVLAQEIAREALLQTVSSNPIDHLAASGLTPRRIAEVLLDLRPAEERGHNAQTAMAMFALRTVLPGSLDKVSVDQLMRFRQDHREELTAFQGFVAAETGPGGSLADLSGLRDSNALEAHLRVQYEKVVAPQLKELRRSLRAIGVGSAYSAINIRLPKDFSVADTLTAIGVAGTAAAAFLNPVFAIATVGLMLLKFRRGAQKEAVAAVAASPAAYLMFARERFTPPTLLESLGQQARHTAIGV